MEKDEKDGILESIRKDEYFQSLINQLDPECREYVSHMVEHMVTHAEQRLKEALQNFT